MRSAFTTRLPNYANSLSALLSNAICSQRLVTFGDGVHGGGHRSSWIDGLAKP
jgi:hypothetical protein